MSYTALNRPKKSLGQNFLVDRRVLKKIIESADLTSNDVVVEVGAGRGFLTEGLSSQVGEVIAVEIDDDLVAHLKNKFCDFPNVNIVHADIRKVDFKSLVPINKQYKVVANLPYYAASYIVRKFLETEHKPELIVSTVQREVAQNMTALPGKMRLLSVMIQLYGKPRIISYVPAGSFRPSPKVMSAIVKIDVYSQKILCLESYEDFIRLVKVGFAAPRKQLHNCFQHGLSIPPETVKDVFELAEIDPKRRAQTLSMIEWGRLYETCRARKI